MSILYRLAAHPAAGAGRLHSAYYQPRSVSAHPHLIGIAGRSGSGKTALARELAALLLGAPGDVLSLDAYYADRRDVAPAARSRLDFDRPEALDRALLAEHLRRLAAGRPVERPVYDFHRHVRSRRTAPLAPGRVVIVEGRLALHHAEVRALLATRVYVAVDAETCLRRRLARDTRERGRTAASVRAQWRATVQPGFVRFVEPTRRHADLVVDGREPLAVLAAAVRRAIGHAIELD